MPWLPLFLPLLLLVAPAAAAEALPQPGGAAVRAVAALDGDTLRLSDGETLRLAGLLAPKRALGQDAAGRWPPQELATATLARLSEGYALQLDTAPALYDRYGRRLAHLFDEAGDWLQAELVRAGMARVDGRADQRAGLAALLALEREARAAGRGLWRWRAYRVLSAEEAGRHLSSFQLVEGQVLAAAVVRGRGYLNFGADWRSDFTVSLAPAVRRLFEAEGLPLADYEGRRLRVRGWLHSFNGPMIEVTHPEQIEVIE